MTPEANSALIVYHGGNCPDGFCAAWVLRSVFPDAEFHAAQYGEPPPDVTGRNVYIVDFSYRRAVMRELLARARRVVVLDHHQTAEAELAGLAEEFPFWPEVLDRDPAPDLPVIRFDMGKSGARLAWEYVWERLNARYETLFDPQTLETVSRDKPPWLVRYVEDHDLWRHALPDSREINAVLRSHPLDFALWDHFARCGPHVSDHWVTEGAAILRYQQQVIDQHCRHAREIEMDGYKVPMVNATTLFSEIAGKLAESAPFAVCYFDRADGFRQYSLRSRGPDGVDVSEIARRRGGGGHRNAAGYQEMEE